MIKRTTSFLLLLFCLVGTASSFSHSTKPSTIRHSSFSSTTTALHAHHDPSLWLLVGSTQPLRQALLHSYTNLLHQFPLATKSITAAVLASAGDAIAQSRSDASDDYDWQRGISFFVFGALYTGAFQHFWFQYLSQHVSEWGSTLGFWTTPSLLFPVDVTLQWDEWWRYFDVQSQLQAFNAPSTTALAAAKLALNQGLVVPLVYMPLFLTFTGVISGMDADQTIARAKSLYLPLLQRNWFFWLPVQFLQFLVVPQELQIPFLSAASLVWTVILSSIGNSNTNAASAGAESVVDYQETVNTEVQQLQNAVNQVTDSVRLEDVAESLPVDALSGMAAGVLASAADEGVVGAAVGELLGGETSLGVAAAAAIGAGLGMALASNNNNKEEEESLVEGMVEASLVEEEDEGLEEDGELEFVGGSIRL